MTLSGFAGDALRCVGAAALHSAGVRCEKRGGYLRNCQDTFAAAVESDSGRARMFVPKQISSILEQVMLTAI